MKSKILLRKVNDYKLAEVEAFVRETVDLFGVSDRLFAPGQKVPLFPFIWEFYDEKQTDA